MTWSFIYEDIVYPLNNTVDFRYGRRFPRAHRKPQPATLVGARSVASYVLCVPAGVATFRSNQLNTSEEKFDIINIERKNDKRHQVFKS
jgi:hypothetical protein